MPAAGDLQPPAGYDDRWAAIALVALAAAAAYYALAWWLTRPRRPRPARADRVEPRRRRSLAALDHIERAVADQRVSSREAYQQVSQVVREFAAAASGRPADTMTLTQLREAGPHELAELVAAIYPPEFGPDEAEGRRRLAETLSRARELVSTWR